MFRPGIPRPDIPEQTRLSRSADDFADGWLVLGVVQIACGEEVDVRRLFQDALHVAAKDPRLGQPKGALVVVPLIAAGLEMRPEDAQAIPGRKLHSDIEDARCMPCRTPSRVK